MQLGCRKQKADWRQSFASKNLTRKELKNTRYGSNTQPTHKNDHLSESEVIAGKGIRYVRCISQSEKKHIPSSCHWHRMLEQPNANDYRF